MRSSGLQAVVQLPAVVIDHVGDQCINRARCRGHGGGEVRRIARPGGRPPAPSRQTGPAPHPRHLSPSARAARRAGRRRQAPPASSAASAGDPVEEARRRPGRGPVAASARRWVAAKRPRRPKPRRRGRRCEAPRPPPRSARAARPPPSRPTPPRRARPAPRATPRRARACDSRPGRPRRRARCTSGHLPRRRRRRSTRVSEAATRSEPLDAFRYHDYGSMATIGRDPGRRGNRPHQGLRLRSRGSSGSFIHIFWLEESASGTAWPSWGNGHGSYRRIFPAPRAADHRRAALAQFVARARV